jgi:hypothetical protein
MAVPRIPPNRCIAPLLVALLAAMVSIASAQTPASSRFDGKWGVTLSCDDTRDKSGALIQGYTYVFDAEIRDGILSAQYGKVGMSSSLTLTGKIHPDGRAEISASGLTGKPEYAIGRIAPSTPYAYRMKGEFGDTTGKVTRIEARPCHAEFAGK